MSNSRKALDPHGYILLAVDGEHSEIFDITLKEGKAIASDMIRNGAQPTPINGGLRFYVGSSPDEYVDLVDVRVLQDAWRYGGRRPAPTRVMESWDSDALAKLPPEVRARQGVE